MRHDPKTSVAIDYNSITDGASLLVINIYFEASESFNIDWNLNKKSLNKNPKIKPQPMINQRIPRKRTKEKEANRKRKKRTKKVTRTARKRKRTKLTH